MAGQGLGRWAIFYAFGPPAGGQLIELLSINGFKEASMLRLKQPKENESRTEGGGSIAGVTKRLSPEK